jgi:hypothetical protein
MLTLSVVCICSSWAILDRQLSMQDIRLLCINDCLHSHDFHVHVESKFVYGVGEGWMRGVRVHCLKPTGSKTAGASHSLENSEYLRARLTQCRHSLVQYPPKNT